MSNVIEPTISETEIVCRWITKDERIREAINKELINDSYRPPAIVIEQYVRWFMPELHKVNGLIHEIYINALDKVDWFEIAKQFNKD